MKCTTHHDACECREGRVVTHEDLMQLAESCFKKTGQLRAKQGEISKEIQLIDDKIMRNVHGRLKEAWLQLQAANKVIKLALEFSDKMHNQLEEGNIQYLPTKETDGLDDAIDEYREKWNFYISD